MKSTYTFVCVLLSAGATMLLPIRASAEQMFVADRLVINVYGEPDQESESIATLETGDTVETIEQLGNFTRVQLSDGTEGWVGANYLMSDTPARLRLQALEKEQKAAIQKSEKQFKAQIDELQKKNEALESEIKALKEADAKAAAEARAEAEAQKAKAPAEPVVQPASSEGGFNFAWLWAPLVVLAGGAGFAAGYQTLARKIRNKFGGVKIY